MPKKKNLISDIEKLGGGSFSKKTMKSISQVTIGDLVDIRDVLRKSKRRKR